MLSGAVLLFAQVQVTNYVDRRERRLKEAGLPQQETSAMMTATGTLRREDIEKLLSRAQGEDVHSPEVEHDVGTARQARAEEPDDEKSAGGATTGAFALVFRTRYLLMIGLLMMLLNLVNTTGEYILDRAMIDAAAAASGDTEGAVFTAEITVLKARFFGVVNMAGLLIQLFVVARVVQFFGVAVGLMILPIISLGGYGMIALLPVFPIIRWVKTAENATDYSLNNTVRNMLFLPTTREQKYKAKQTIDSFFSRVGDTLQAVVVFLGTAVFALSTAGFALINMSIAVVWLFLAYKIGKEYKRLVNTDETPR